MALLLPSFAAVAACGGGGAGTSPWAGKTYALDVPAANWSQPANIGGDIGAFVPEFLISVASGSGQELTVTLGTGTAGVQDPCNPTTQVTTNVASYPDVQITASTFPLRIVNSSGGVTVNTTTHDLSLSNVLPGQAPATEGTLTATVDIAEAYPLFTLIPDATKDSVCAVLGQNGAACVTCAFNGQPYCLTLEAVQLGAVQSSGSVTPIAAADVPASCAP